MNKTNRKPISTSVTLQDIAESVGISKVAVSVVPNGSHSNTRVSEATRQRILEAAAKLNYHPNAAAQGLRRGRTNTLGLMFGVTLSNILSMSSSLSASIMQGVAVAAEAESHNMMLFIDLIRDGSRGLNCLRDQRTDGAVIAMPLVDTDMVDVLLSMGHPLVFIGYPSRVHGISSVDIDNVHAAYDAATHLLDLGHRHIAYFQGELEYACTLERQGGFLRAMLEAGIVTPPEYLVQDTYRGETTGATLRRVMALPNPPTAIFCGNDLMAGVLIRAAQEMGISVPSQLSVIGFDDVFLPNYMDAPITTIRQPFFDMGREAARLLMKKLRGEEEQPISLIMDHELVIRNTTAPPMQPRRN